MTPLLGPVGPEAVIALLVFVGLPVACVAALAYIIYRGAGYIARRAHSE